VVSAVRNKLVYPHKAFNRLTAAIRPARFRADFARSAGRGATRAEARELAHANTMGFALAFACCLHQVRGDWQAARETFRACRTPAGDTRTRLSDAGLWLAGAGEGPTVEGVCRCDPKENSLFGGKGKERFRRLAPDNRAQRGSREAS
jgi:hypothetical protein